jgi:RNA polymerase-binding protein DksA
MGLSKPQLDDFTRLLEARRASLLEDVRGELERPENLQYIELIDRVPADIGDQSVGDALADLNLAIVDRHVREIREIEAAYVRLREGRYGICADCGDDIAEARLRAWPTAERCQACQQHREKTFRHDGTPTL